MLIQNFHLPASVLQDFNRGLRSLRHKVVVECVSPQKHFWASDGMQLAFAKPCLERFCCKCRNLPLLRHSRCHFGHSTQAWKLSKQVSESRNNGSQPGPFIDPAKRVSMH